MKKLFIFLFCVISYAQTVALSMFPVSNAVGGVSTLSVTYTDTVPTSNIAVLNWQLSLPAGVTIGTVMTGPAALSSGQTCTCTLGTCTVGVVSSSTYLRPGVVALIPINVSTIGSFSVGVNSSSGTTLLTAGATTIPLSIAPVSFMVVAPVSTLWFTAQVNDSICRVYKINQLPIKVNWYCPVAFGSSSGEFTSTYNPGGTVYFTLGFNSIAQVLGLTNNNMSCTIQLNGTGSSSNMLNGEVVSPYSGSYQCSGYTTTGFGQISWP